MRTLFGIILGVALTVGVAFIVDASASAPATTGSGSTAVHRNMVNWDVVGDNMRLARERAHHVWSKLSQKVAS